MSTAPIACSGAMYAGVPTADPARVPSLSRSDRIAVPAVSSDPTALPAATGPRTLANPQSITCTSPNAPTITFSGFRSRWMTPLLCA